jgi:Tfp pilus assembly protein PilV
MRLGKVGGRLRKPRWSGIVRSQRGQALIEVLIAVCILGVVAVAFLSALVVGYQGVILADEKTMAESLTRTQLENIRYAEFPIPTGSDTVTTILMYDVTVHADYIDPDTYAVSTDPTQIQLVTVTVNRHYDGRFLLSASVSKVQ